MVHMVCAWPLTILYLRHLAAFSIILKIAYYNQWDHKNDFFRTCWLAHTNYTILFFQDLLHTKFRYLIANHSRIDSVIYNHLCPDQKSKLTRNTYFSNLIGQLLKKVYGCKMKKNTKAKFLVTVKSHFFSTCVIKFK